MYIYIYIWFRVIEQVDPSLPVVYVTAGLSALEISEAFCRTHSLGASQVPLVRT